MTEKDKTLAFDRLDLSARLAVVAVGGADAARFLQAQLTCDVARLGNDHGCYGAYLSPQGRVLATAYVIATGQDYLLLLHPSLVEPVTARLSKYVLRDDVQFQPMAEMAVSGGGKPLTPDAAPDLSLLPIAEISDGFELRLPDGRRIAVGARARRGPVDRWWQADLRAGIAMIERATSDQHIPQALALDRIKAVSFAKGCYPGQEIVARVHYRGRVKRVLRLLRGGAGPEPGEALFDTQGSRCGQIVGCAAEDHASQLMLAVVSEGSDSVAVRNGEPMAVLERFV